MERPCSIHDHDKYYDLSKLTASEDYEFATPGGHNITLNVCRSVIHDPWNVKVSNPGNIGGLIRRDRGDFSIGEFNSTLCIKHSRPFMILTNGSPCIQDSGEGLRASTAVEFICDNSVSGVGKPLLLMQLPPDEDSACGFFVEWRTQYACPTSEKGSMGFFSILVTIILIAVMLYIVLGTLYNRFVLNLRGFDQIPQFSLASAKYHAYSVFEWLKEISEHQPNGLNDNHSRTNPISHQAQSLGAGVGRNGQRFERRSGKETNPVSHHSRETIRQDSELLSPQPRSTEISKKLRDLEQRAGMPNEERVFMLEEDGGEDGVDEDDTKKPSPPVESFLSNEIAGVRGRGIGTDDVIRL